MTPQARNESPAWPDAVARRRLLDLYAAGLDLLDVADWSQVVDASADTSPAFIREAIRQAAHHAAERDGDDGHVGEPDFLDAIERLKHQSGRLTATLLGTERSSPANTAVEDGAAEEGELFVDADQDW